MPYLRRWQIHQIAPDRFTGSMSEAPGPIVIQQLGGRYRFTFKMKGDMSVEQWLSPTSWLTSGEQQHDCPEIRNRAGNFDCGR